MIRSTIRTNQKCFVLRDPRPSKLVNKFILGRQHRGEPTAARPSSPATSASSARACRDAKFFYEIDLKTKLEDRLPKFDGIVFHEKLGTQAERIARIVALAGQLAPLRRRRCRQGRSAPRSSAKPIC